MGVEPRTDDPPAPTCLPAFSAPSLRPSSAPLPPSPSPAASPQRPPGRPPCGPPRGSGSGVLDRPCASTLASARAETRHGALRRVCLPVRRNVDLRVGGRVSGGQWGQRVWRQTHALCCAAAEEGRGAAAHTDTRTKGPWLRATRARRVPAGHKGPRRVARLLGVAGAKARADTDERGDENGDDAAVLKAKRGEHWARHEAVPGCTAPKRNGRWGGEVCWETGIEGWVERSSPASWRNGRPEARPGELGGQQQAQRRRPGRRWRRGSR
jgi:hypothetical protein